MPADPAAAALYRLHRFPAEIINHAVWLYFRFNLSHRDVEELLAERGVHVSYEAIRLWCHKFGPAYAEHLRRRRPGPADKMVRRRDAAEDPRQAVLAVAGSRSGRVR